MFNNKLAKTYKEMFETPQGKKVLEDLIKFSRATAPSYQVGDPTQTAYNEGMRRVGLRIIGFLTSKETDLIDLQEQINKINEINLNREFE